jgi:hypothetical protein
MGGEGRMKDGRRGKNEGWEEREEQRLGRERRMKDGRRGKNERWEEG